MTTNSKQPQQIELAYIAGFVDGEGHIGLATRKPLPGHHQQYRERIYIGNCDQSIIKYIQSLFPKGTTHQNIRYSKKHRPLYRVHYSSLNAIELAKALLPYLRVKKEQAKKLIEFRDKITLIDRHASNRVLPEKEYQRRTEIYQTLKRLNQRGVQL